ncbi:MAG: MmcQ/YjbR family DNA-binding protein, partial [Gaiellaceae bacterium]
MADYGEVLDRIRELCFALPETSERLSHGHPTFFVRGKRSFAMVL